ncbi:hypothetical protein BC332_00866 [Capsicum chinense]|nr:hypothetical protein BC332_00866 [Capsicum chinense]
MPSPNLAGKPITESLHRIMASSSGGEDGLNSINPPSSKSQKVSVAGDEEHLDRISHFDSDIDVDNENVNDPSLEIFAPYLEHLEISGNLDNLKCRLVDVSSLVNARLTFYISCIKHVRRDHGDDIGVDEYSCHDYHQDKTSNLISARHSYVVCKVPCMLQFKGLPVPELKCKYLTLELNMENFDLYGAAGLFGALPYVETLNIDMTENHVCLMMSSSVWSFDSPERIWGFDMLVELSKLLLKNATILEKLVIISKRRTNFFSRLAKQLLDFPRSSSELSMTRL